MSDIAIITFKVKDGRRWRKETVIAGPFTGDDTAPKWADRLIDQAAKRGIRLARPTYHTQQLFSPRESLETVLDLGVDWQSGQG